MIRPVEGSELAEQMELARQSIEAWPEWLKEAADVGGKEGVESPSSQKQPDGKAPMSIADFID